MKTKKRFFLKAAGISLAKAAGISLAFVLTFAMAFAACDTGTSSGGRTPTPTAPATPTPKSNTFTDKDKNWTVELTITEILSASTQTADSQTADSQTVYSVAAPTSGEVFYYAIRVKGYSEPVSQGTVTVGTSAWTFTSRKLGISFPINVSVSGERLIFAETTIPTDSGTPTTITIPTLNVPDTGSSGTGGISSGPSAAELAAQALVANRVLAGKAEVSGTTVTLTSSITLEEGETLSIPADVTLAVAAGKTLTIAADAKLEVANGATVKVEGNNGNILFTPDEAGQTGRIANNGTIELNTAPASFAEILQKSTGSGKIKLTAQVADSSGLRGPLALGQALEIADGGSIKFDTGTTKAFEGTGSVTISGNGSLDLGSDVTSLGRPIINNGTSADAVKTSTVTGSVLKTILDAVTGNITASGANISLPASGATTTVKTGTTLTVSGSLAVPAGAGLTLTDASSKVAVTGTLDLATIPTTTEKAITLNGGTIEVDGIFLGPVPIGTGEDKAGQTPQIDWTGGSIVFNKGSKGYFGTVSGDYYIGPDNESPHYKWDATNPGTVTLKGNELILEGYLTSAEANYIADKATIKPNAVLTVKAGLTIGSTGNLVVENNAEVIVEGDGGTLVSEDGSKGTLTGTVTVKSGGILKDRNPSGGSLWNENETTSGSIIFESGAKAYGPVDTIALIDTTGCTPAATIFELVSGATLTLKKDQFILDGNATVHGTYSIAVTNGLTIKAGSTLTVNNLWTNDPADAINFLWVTTSINGEPATGEKVASKLVSTTYIIYGNGNTNVPKFYKADGSAAYGATGPAQPDHRSVELGTYNWDANADGNDGEGWKKE